MTKEMMKNQSLKSVAAMIAAMSAELGVKHAVVSSGSRSMPIATAFDVADSINVKMIVDERVAAFAALGMTKHDGAPVALVCTSGSALLNYAPAVAEAYYIGAPLLVISADRPAWQIDQNAGQTIRQFGALSNIVKASVDIDGDSDNPLKWRGMVADAMLKAIIGKPGPVHINVHLSEPLQPTLPFQCNSSLLPKLISPTAFSDSQFDNMVAQLQGRKVMLYIGPENLCKVSEQTISKLQNSNVVVVADRATVGITDADVSHFDDLLQTANSSADIIPDLLITTGVAPLSRKFRELISSASNLCHWQVSSDAAAKDFLGHISTLIVSDSDIFLNQLADKQFKADANYRNAICRLQSQASESVKNMVAKGEWSADLAVDMILSAVPNDYKLHFSNGITLRKANRFIKCGVTMSANRGVNGIDGSTSTALGAAYVAGGKHLLLTGDMSAFYDIAALQSGLINDNFRMVVINNSGGDIFRCIEATRNVPNREQLLCAMPNVDWQANAVAANMKYVKVTSADALSASLDELLNGASAMLMEVVVAPTE